MSSVTDLYTKNYSTERRKECERRVRELSGDMSEESAADLVAKQMREEMKDGGMIDKPLGSGGVKSGPPPKSGPTPQGLKVPEKKIIVESNSEKNNVRNRQVSTKRRAGNKIT